MRLGTWKVTSTFKNGSMSNLLDILKAFEIKCFEVGIIIDLKMKRTEVNI